MSGVNLDPHRLFIDGDRIDAPGVKQHLLLDLGLEAEYKIQVLPYKSILSELKTLCADLSPREKVWVSDKASYAVSEAIPKVSGLSPPCLYGAGTFVVLMNRAGWALTCGLCLSPELDPGVEPLRPFKLLGFMSPGCGGKDGLGWHTLILRLI